MRRDQGMGGTFGYPPRCRLACESPWQGSAEKAPYEVDVELTAEGLKAFEIQRMTEEAQYEENSRLHRFHRAKAAEYKKAALTPWSLLIRR